MAGIHNQYAENRDFPKPSSTPSRSISPQHEASKENVELALPRVSPDFPEGGLQAWLTVLGGTIVLFCTFGVVQSFGVYQDYYTRIFLSEHTPSEVSWIGSTQVFFVFALGLPTGRLFDAGYFHHCLLSGSATYLFSIMMLSLAKPHHYYQVFLSQGVGMGLGMGLMMLPSLTIASHYFRRRRSLAMGVVVAGSSLGGCLYPILLNNIFGRSEFGWGVRAVGFLDLGLLVIANLIMRTRLPPKKTRAAETYRLFKEVVTDLPFISLLIGGFMVFWGVFIPFFYLQLYASLHHINPKFNKYSLTVMNAASIIGRTLPNFIADVYGAVTVMIVCSLISSGLIFGIFGASSTGGVIAFGICYGFFSGGIVSLIAPAGGAFAQHRDLSDIGIRIGVLSSGISFALLTGNPIAGALLAPPHYRWANPLIFSSVTLFAGAVFQAIAWKYLSKRRGSKRV